VTQTIGNKVDVPDLVIACRTRSTQIRFAVERCEETLRKDGGKLTHYDLSELPAAVDVLVICGEDDARTLSSNGIEITLDGNLKKEGFEIRRCKGKKKEILCVLASDETGAMYGVLELGEQLSLHGSPDKIQPRVSNPRFEFRGIKFNLPWSSYRRGKAMQLHTDTCRDLDFWRAFLEMMAVNRFNVLTLWNLHPFTFMIRPEGYPEACPFNDEELAQWKSFWKELFRIARDLGIETYIVNWNICISPELARARSLEERNDTSQFVRDYTRQCVTQTINEYEDLTGLGVTLADWMKDMTPRERSARRSSRGSSLPIVPSSSSIARYSPGTPQKCATSSTTPPSHTQFGSR